MPRYGVVIGFRRSVAQLNEREPGRWHHETRFNGGTSSMALNGGGKMAGGTEATSLSSDELVVAIRHFGRFPDASSRRVVRDARASQSENFSRTRLRPNSLHSGSGGCSS